MSSNHTVSSFLDSSLQAITSLSLLQKIPQEYRFATVVTVTFSPFLVSAVWKLAASYIRSIFMRKLTIMHDLNDLGKPRPSDKRIKGTAVICGGSISGLWAARVCADHFDDVLVIEAEPWVATEEGQTAIYDEKGVMDVSKRVHDRTRVEQYTSLHFFQPLNHMVAKVFYPNFEEEIVKSGGKIGPSDPLTYAYGGIVFRFPYPEGKGPNQPYISRESYERVLRGLTRKSSPRIRWLTGTVTDLDLAPKDPSKISLVTVRTPEKTEVRIPASLVIDCTGRTQAGFKWIKRVIKKAADADSQRYSAISKESLDHLREDYEVNSPYTSFRFAVPEELRSKLPIPGGFDNARWLYTNFPVAGEETLFTLFNKLEGHRLELAFGSWGERPFPQDTSEILDFFYANEPKQGWPDWVLKTLEIVIDNNVPVVFIRGKYPSLSWIHYEKFPYLPDNLIAIGDAAMIVNPIYGQGNAKAAIGAVSLDSTLRSTPYSGKDHVPSGFSKAFFEKQVARTRSAWEGTKPNDYNFDTTIPVKGEKLSDTWFQSKFGKLMMHLCLYDSEIDSTLWHVRNFFAPSTDLLHPVILGKALTFAIKRQLGFIKY